MHVVEVVVAADEVELASDALWQAGASAVSEEPRDDGRVTLRADVTAPSRVDPRWDLTVVEPDTEAHLDAWRAFARPVRAGSVLLQPAWLPDVDPTGARAVVRLDPGRAFGSGSHASTRLVLDALDRLPLARADVLDVGCGSGVLGVAAALLGAGSVTAIDVDPEAMRATVDNAARNAVVIVASTTPLAEVDGRYDLVLANIGAAVLVELAGDLWARVRPGGHLVLAGLLDDQAGPVASAYPQADEVERVGEDGWVAISLRRPGATG